MYSRTCLKVTTQASTAKLFDAWLTNGILTVGSWLTGVMQSQLPTMLTSPLLWTFLPPAPLLLVILSAYKCCLYHLCCNIKLLHLTQSLSVRHLTVWNISLGTTCVVQMTLLSLWRMIHCRGFQAFLMINFIIQWVLFHLFAFTSWCPQGNVALDGCRT